MDIPKMLRGGILGEYSDTCTEAEVREVIVVKQRVREGDGDIYFIFDLDGTLIAVKDPRTERGYSK